ncbi:uncharacterized protein LOC111358101 isoform X2 [Spodoptera litura]|uniref:Uncharacterized protein LOC111358101 isoform X2 n=1 Tax=Spodoptera litura TaxID=69820 RepID=A0A9J7EHV5_SPOLT|nr:uncharacterized protein LOC111358101 isoform X2 [Spodoptera litura]
MKHCILIFSLCIVGQFMNGYSLSGLLRHASKSDVSGSSDKYENENMNHQIAKGVIIYTKDSDDMRLIVPDKGDQSDDNDSGDNDIDRNYMAEDVDDQDNEENNNGDDNDSDEEYDGLNDAGDDKRNPTNNTDNKKETFERFVNEMKFGDTADLLGHNQHMFQSPIYMDLGRRFVPQYKYSDVYKETAAEHSGDLIPEKAPPELVLVVAKESALLGPDKENDLGDIDQKKILRSGDYWNSVWKEEVNVKTPLRSDPENKVLVNKETAAEHSGDLIPEKAPPELVLVVAKESALLGPDKENDLGDIDQKKILRSGDYWNSVWKEEVNVKTPLRSAPEKKVLGSIKVKIKPGTEFHKVVSRMKKMSPRLLYIINKKLH